MDWIRLTKSGKDLAGTGGRMLQVTSKELAKHNLRNDCWMALNGIVYNVTAYMDFHPGNYEIFLFISYRDFITQQSRIDLNKKSLPR